MEPLIDHLVERSRNDDDRPSDGMKSQLDEALTKRHETDAKLVQAEARIAQLEEVVRWALLKIWFWDLRFSVLKSRSLVKSSQIIVFILSNVSTIWHLPIIELC